MAYVHAADDLLEQVNSQLEANPKIRALIGNNPIELMRDNHRNHAKFMATVFHLNSHELLVRTIPWVYRAYHARGFAFDYFPVELVAWQIAIYECIASADQKAEILAVYNWLVQHHEDMIKLAVTGKGSALSALHEENEIQQTFLSLLLHGNSRGCLALADQSIRTADDLKHFYLDVVWPAMVRIGLLWESNHISVAEEHLATAIVGRVMAALYPRFTQFSVSRGKVVVSAGPNEFHEVGARMVADFMEMDGWDVTYLGTNIPAPELLAILKLHKPFLVALSVATIFNLDNAHQLIQRLKEEPETKDIKVMVGGLAFNSMPALWQDIGADGCAADANSATALSNEWWITRGDNHA